MSYTALTAVAAVATQAIVGMHVKTATCYSNATGEGAAISAPLNQAFLAKQCTDACAEKKRTKPFFYQVQSQDGDRLMIKVGETKCWIDPTKFKIQVIAVADAPTNEDRCSEHQGVLGAGPVKCRN